MDSPSIKRCEECGKTTTERDLFLWLNISKTYVCMECTEASIAPKLAKDDDEIK